ncbi:MAG: leucine-rich repeat domain-containing protein [Candidatus Helarchaeota archaeon]
MVAEKKEDVKSFPIKDKEGNLVFTIKLLGDKSTIFIGDDEITTCRFVPIQIPEKDLPHYDKIEYINDILDDLDTTLEDEGYWFVVMDEYGLTREELSELDFFVNCSNLQAWVEHDYDIRLLDYNLAFPLLKELAKRGNKRAAMRFKEQLVQSIHYGNRHLREFAGFLRDDLTDEEYYSVLPPEELKALQDLTLLNLLLKTKDEIIIDVLRKGRVAELKLTGSTVKEEKIKPFRISSDMTQKIFDMIAQFKHLEELEIYSIPFTELPGTQLNRLEHLEKLELSGLSLESLLEGLSDCPSLKHMILDGCSIKQFSASFGNLTGLEKLEIHDCPLTTLPESIGNLNSLKEFVIHSCSLTTLPESIGNLSSLKELEIHDCPLTTLPESIGNLKSLEDLNLERNQLETLPDSFGGLENLKFLDLTGNRLKKLPPSFSQLKNLLNLDLSKNAFTDIPKEVCFLPNLESLVIMDNRIKTIPDEIKNLKTLRVLLVSGNEIETIPEVIAKLPQLGSLILTANKITELPGNLHEFKEMKIVLYENPISEEKVKEYREKYPHLTIKC